MNEQERQELNQVMNELALFQLNELKRDAEMEARIKKWEAIIADITGRIATLEDARKRQIEINTKLLEDTDFLYSDKPKPKRSLWNIFKR